MWPCSDPVAALSNPNPERVIQGPTIKRARIGTIGTLPQAPIQVVQTDVQLPQAVNMMPMMPMVPMAATAPGVTMVPMAAQAVPMSYMVPGQAGWNLPGVSQMSLNVGNAQPNVVQRFPHADASATMQQFGASRGGKGYKSKGGWWVFSKPAFHIPEMPVQMTGFCPCSM